MPSDNEDLQLLTTHSVEGTTSKPSKCSYVALATVPLLWGTFTPSMKLLLNMKHAPPVMLTNLSSHIVGTAALALLWALEALPRESCLPINDMPSNGMSKERQALRASCELGLYLFCGQLTQLVGLTGTTATINAILVQSSVVFVPLFEGRIPTSSVWACINHLMPSLLALCGIALITVVPKLQQSASGSDPAAEETTLGIVCSLCSALCYAMHTVRLSAYASIDATVQATGQVAVNTLLDVVLLPIASLLGYGSSSRRWLYHANDAAIRKLGIAATWNGIMIVGATTWAMSYAQRTVRASTAALAYALEPLFAAVLAAMVLDESLGIAQLAGGFLVVAANILVGKRQI